MHQISAKYKYLFEMNLDMNLARFNIFIENIKQRNPGQPEYLQAVAEVMESVWPFIVDLRLKVTRDLHRIVTHP